MMHRRDNQKLKSAVSFLVILLLLPYVVTVFVNGADMEAAGKGSSTYIQVKSQDKNGNEIIADLPWEEYFIGVMAKEIPGSYEPEALKAQAVTVRTTLYKQLGGSAGDTGEDSGEESGEESGEDSSEDSGEENGEENGIMTESYLTADEMEKKWGAAKFEEYYEKMKAAMEATGNQILLYQDSYAWTPFHQSSNGRTRSGEEVLGNGDYPYLAVRECPLDKEADDEMQVYVFEYDEIKEKCQSFLVAADGKEEAEKTFKFEDFEVKSSDSAGYVSEFRIGDTVCTGDQFRDAMSLASSSFSIQDGTGKLKVTTVGIGHGLGMSQWTANEMAKEGRTYEEILQFFFEGTSLSDGGEIFSKIE